MSSNNGSGRGTWLGDYLEYTSTQESPEAFHLWCGVTLIAATVNRKVYLPRISKDGVERFRLYPGQIAVVLVAGSGKAKKSTAIADMAQTLLKEAGTATIFDGKVTPERLLAKLGSQPSGKAIMTIIQHELTTFLSKQTYNEHMIDILTKLCDCKDDAYETQQKTYTLRDVCCTQLYGTTPRNLGEGVPPQAHDTGFMGRYLFVFGDRSGKIEPLSATSVDSTVAIESLKKRSSLVQRLREYAKLSGPFAWTQTGKEWFDEWYTDYMNSPASEGEGWPQRKPDHLLRLAMVLSISNGNGLGPLYIDEFVQNAALTMLEGHIEANFPKCFAYIGRHANAEAQGRIIEVFHSRVGVPVSSEELYARTLKYFGNARELTLALHGMRLAGLVKVSQDKLHNEWWTLLKEPY